MAAFYQGAADAGRQAAFMAPTQFKRLPMIVAPALYCLSGEFAGELEAYVRDGGHLILTFRTGYADEEARARTEIAPGPLRALAGVRYLEYSTLLKPVPLRWSGGQDVARHWADGLEPEGAEPLARYDHPHFGRWPAITRNRVGAGTVTYVGTLPGRMAHGGAVPLSRPGPRPARRRRRARGQRALGGQRGRRAALVRAQLVRPRDHGDAHRPGDRGHRAP